MIVFNQQLASNKIEEEELIDLLFFVVVVVCVGKKNNCLPASLYTNLANYEYVVYVSEFCA